MSSQPTRVECQPTAADCAEFLQRIKALTQEYEENLKKRNVDIGFNLFELISDHYYRETFHSDILNALLDPNGKHQEGRKYLDLFLEFLRSQPGVTIDLAHYSDAQVAKEEGRIDILIKGHEHAIIIENKIYGAIDQPTQLPDYLKKVKEKGYDCDAIIYLRLNGNIPPDRTGWKTHPQRAEVDEKLKVICAYDGTDDGTEKDLLKGWILKCWDKSKENSDAQHIVHQYGGIIKKLGRNVMNGPIMKKFYEILVQDEGKNLKTALSLKKMLDELVEYRVKNIIDKFASNFTPFKKIAICGNNDAYFERCNWKDAELGLDIVVGPESYSFQFWDKADRPGKKGRAKEMLQQLDCPNEYVSNAGPDAGLFCKEFAFSSQGEEDLIKHITDFKKKLGEVVSND
jgi:hypothetical protein